MVSHLFFYQFTLIALVWLYVMLQWAWSLNLSLFVEDQSDQNT